MKALLSGIALVVAFSTMSSAFANGELPAQTAKAPTPAAKELARKLLRQAEEKAQAGDREGVMRDITEVIKLDPTIPKAYCMRATCKQAKGDNRGALADCTYAITLEPNGYPGLYVRRAIPEYQLKMFNECIRDCSTTLKRDPKFLMAYKYRAMAKVQLDQHENAVSDINAYLKLAPNDEAAKEFRDKLMAEIQPTARDDEQVEQGYQDAGKTQSVKIEHKLHTFLYHNHSFQLLPPLNFTFKRSPLPEGEGESFGFIGPPDLFGTSPTFHVEMILPAAVEPGLTEKVMSEAILRPFRQRMTGYIEREAQFQLANKTCNGVYFEGKELWIFGYKGFSFVTKSNDALFIFFGLDSDRSFDKSMRLFSETLKTCTIK